MPEVCKIRLWKSDSLIFFSNGQGLTEEKRGRPRGWHPVACAVAPSADTGVFTEFLIFAIDGIFISRDQENFIFFAIDGI